MEVSFGEGNCQHSTVKYLIIIPKNEVLSLLGVLRVLGSEDIKIFSCWEEEQQNKYCSLLEADTRSQCCTAVTDLRKTALGEFFSVAQVEKVRFAHSAQVKLPY